MASEQSARERLREQANAAIARNKSGSCVECYPDGHAESDEWPHFPGCYAVVDKAIDLALARIAELERELSTELVTCRIPEHALYGNAADTRAALELAKARVRDLERERDEARRESASLRERLRASQDMVQAIRETPWGWQGDGSDDLDSMSDGMGITILAGQLRALLAGKDEREKGSE